MKFNKQFFFYCRVAPNSDKYSNHLLITLRDVVQTLQYLDKLPAPFFEKLKIITCQINLNEYIIMHRFYDPCGPQAYRFFKPIFDRRYFMYHNRNETNDKSMITLQLLEIACLALMQLSEQAVLAEK